MSQVVREDVRCGECGELVHFWTKYRTPEGTVENEQVDRRCSCQVVQDTQSAGAERVVPEYVLH